MCRRSRFLGYWLTISRIRIWPPQSGVGMPISLKQLIETHQRAMSASSYGCPRITCATTWAGLMSKSVASRISMQRRKCYVPSLETSSDTSPCKIKYLKLQVGNPMVAELHQRGPQGPVDMVIPNGSEAKACFEMFNKQPAKYLYHMLPLFGATQLFVKTILHWSMDADLATEAPLCTYDEGRQILTTPRDAQQESILSDICSLPFFNRNTAIRVRAWTKNIRPVGFLHRNYYIN